MSENIARKDDFSQVCVWPGTIVGEDKVNEFVEFMLKDLGVRVQYLEEIKTKATPGNEIKESGGRNDLFFAIHSGDIGKFAVKRLKIGIKWVEDMWANGGAMIYPERVSEYKTW